ncbi:MAG: lytic transglycosylase domain-containing protein [Parahaliea sp.]
MARTALRIALLAALSVSLTCTASVDAQHDSRALYKDIATYVGVRADVLYAIALAESGRRHADTFAPWPWTLNIEGEARYYDDREAMFKALMQALGEGKLRVDVGPMQVNWYWQQAQVSSPWRLTDPGTNLKLAAQILKQQYQRSGDWRTAAGHYHRPFDNSTEGQALAEQYRQRVWRFLEQEAVRETP